jgi:hypothetical protein
LSSEERSTIAATAIIFIFAVGGWFVMPPLMRWLGSYSQWLAYLAAALFVGALFIIFWFRARYQRSKGK